MNIKKYKSEYCTEITELFYNTVHTINAKDYTPSQLNVWATDKIDIAAWDKSFLNHYTIVAEINNVIVGFGDVDSNGYIDRMYVHKDYQKIGVASAILAELELYSNKHGLTNFTTYASITAVLFFKKHGYNIIYENRVVKEGVELVNYFMQK